MTTSDDSGWHLTYEPSLDAEGLGKVKVLHALPPAHPPRKILQICLPKTLKGRDCRHWYGCCVLKRTVGRLQRQFIFRRTRILCKSPTAHAEHLVAWFDWVTFLPTASTWPARSTPSRVTLGLRSPAPRRRMYGVPLTKCQSSGLTEAARTLIKTSLSLGTGFATSVIWTTSGAPYLL